MPGLIGFIDINKKNAKELILEKMIQSAKHESWYHVDKYIKGKLAIARINLGIFNPETHPIFNEDKSAFIFFQGEIYDYDNIKRKLEKRGHIFKINNDAEFVLHLYEERGLNFVNNLNGSFVCAIWDEKDNRLVIVNDRYGLRPLYYTELANQFVFSCEVKPITCFPGFRKEINLRAIPDLLAFGSMLGENTLFEGIFLMPSGSIMVYQDGKLTINKYWDFEYIENYPKRAMGDYCEELNYLFGQSIKRQLKGSFRIGVPLSGGLDSRVVSAYIQKEHMPFSTYTYGAKGYYDYRFAKRVARVLKTDHHFYETRGEYIPCDYKDSLELTNGLLDICDTQQIILPKRINNGCEVLYIGFFGDVLFGGSNIREDILNLRDDEKLPELIYNSFSYFIKDWMQKDLFKKSMYEKIRNASKENIEWRLSQANSKIPVNKADYIYLNERAKRFTINANLILLNNKLEYRTPTYDNDLINFALALPPRLRVNSLLYKELLKRYYPKLARIPWQKDGLPLTASPIRRRIHNSLRYRLTHFFGGGFAKFFPYKNCGWDNRDDWIRIHKDFLLRILLDKKTLNRPYFNQKYIQEQIIEPHMSGKANQWAAISILTTFELWHRNFFDE